MGEEIGYPYIVRSCYTNSNDSFKLVKGLNNVRSINEDTYKELSEVLELDKVILHKDTTIKNLHVCYYK